MLVNFHFLFQAFAAELRNNVLKETKIKKTQMQVHVSEYSCYSCKSFFFEQTRFD